MRGLWWMAGVVMVVLCSPHIVLAQSSVSHVFHAAQGGTSNGTPMRAEYYSTIGVQVEGTWSGTLTFRSKTKDAVAYVDTQCRNRADGAVSTTATGNGYFDCPGPAYEFIVASSVSSGSVSVSGLGSIGAAGSAAGGAGGGGGTQYAEDSAHVSGDTVTMAGVVQQTADAALAANGDRTVLQVDENGFLKVNIKAGAGSGGTAMADDAAFTPGTTSITPIGAMFDDVTPDSVNEGDAGIPRMSANRNLYTTIRDAAGNERGANVNASNELLTSSNTELPTAAALADNTANPTVPGVAAFLMCYDGSTWDRCQGGLTDADDGTIAAAQAPSLSVTIPYEYDGTNWTRPRGPNTVAHDAADAGNPIKIGAFAESSVSGATSVADGDRTNLKAGLDGVLLVRPHSNLEDRVSGTAGITDGSSTSIVAAQGAGVRFCATTIVVSNSSATNVTVDIRDGTAGSVLMTIPAAANMGGGVVSLQTPLCTTANTIFAADPSASASTVAVTAVGFKTAL